MLFNSIEFTIFLPIVFAFYWLLNSKIKLQNFFLLIASYFFYGWWDWRFLLLIIFSSFIDYCIGIALQKENYRNKKKFLLGASIIVNIGLLGFFKYSNFFIDNFLEAYRLFGNEINPRNLNIILPVGISFYTFQTLSYTIDIYKGKLKPTKNIIMFFTFVSFFPQLVAGPIERAKNLLPQFSKKRIFEYKKASDGMRQILWGLFKKIVIADTCAIYVDDIFVNYLNYSGSTLLLGIIFFAFQIYCDFSGYSDIAIGTGRLFGISLKRNFSFPYFSRDIAEFWRRWHISLSSWFRDYVYIPLGGSRIGGWKKVRNIFLIFLLSGFWHGANWTFIIWGFLNAIYFLPLMWMNKNRHNLNTVSAGKLFPSIKEFIQIGSTFSLTLIAWIFFRSESVKQAFDYINGIFSISIFLMPSILPYKLIFLLILFILVEWFQREEEHGLNLDSIKFPKVIRWSVYYGIIALIYRFSSHKQEFIYFQF